MTRLKFDFGRTIYGRKIDDRKIDGRKIDGRTRDGSSITIRKRTLHWYKEEQHNSMSNDILLNTIKN